MRKYLIFAFFVSSLTSLFGQVPNPYLFLDWKDQEDHTLYVGELVYQDSFDCSIEYNKDEYEDNKNSIDIYFAKLKEQIASMPKDKPDLLFYIHGFGAYRSHFVKLNNSTLQRDIVSKEGSTIGMQLSYSWTIGYNYVGGIPKSVDLGYYYGELIAETIKLAKENNPETRVHFITHSMGNRVYLGVFDKLNEVFDYPIIDHHIMAAPDVEPNIFAKGEPLENIADVDQEVTVYRHNTDRILTISGELTEKTRLGLLGLTDEEFEVCSEIVKVVDCSLLNDNERFDFGNHNYYYQSPTVRNDMFNILFDRKDELTESRKSLKHPRRFVLQFPEVEESENE